MGSSKVLGGLTQGMPADGQGAGGRAGSPQELRAHRAGLPEEFSARSPPLRSGLSSPCLPALRSRRPLPVASEAARPGGRGAAGQPGLRGQPGLSGGPPAGPVHLRPRRGPRPRGLPPQPSFAAAPHITSEATRVQSMTDSGRMQRKHAKAGRDILPPSGEALEPNDETVLKSKTRQL